MYILPQGAAIHVILVCITCESAHTCIRILLRTLTVGTQDTLVYHHDRSIEENLNQHVQLARAQYTTNKGGGLLGVLAVAYYTPSILELQLGP